ncbi:MAG: T9SS type A sorting domain-containing protein [Calditrichaeota bacterium]|nr:T9SS type A sorting domain-containing protein [Calditrichota bacterium]
MTVIIILLSILFGSLVPTGFVEAIPAGGDAAISVQVVREGPAGLTTQMRFAAPEIAIADPDGEPRLRVDLGGALPDFESDGPALPVIFRLIAVPDGYETRAEVRIVRERSIDVEPILARDRAGERELRDAGPQPMVEVGEAGWMRWLRVAPVVIRPVRYDAGSRTLQAAEEIAVDFEFVPTRPSGVATPDPACLWSPTFDELFRVLLLNPGSLPGIMPGGNPVHRGSYIIITNRSLSAATIEFAKWKRKKGFDVVVNPMYYPGITADEIRNYIQDAYDRWERPPEVVLLLGDVNAPSMSMPSYSIRHPDRNQQEVDVTDLPYSLMTGDDYYPDLFVGRVSVDSLSTSEATIYFSRIVAHETIAHTFPQAAFKRATLFAGNFGDGGRRVLSPVETCEWLGSRLRERGWNVQDFYFRRAGDDVNPGPIVESINRGVNIVAYRGWADARGTHYPQFYKVNLDQLDNGPLLPIFTFFVCNTGDFGSNETNPCFGEYAITRGTRRRPAAALSFFGPSDLHTNTRFNNPLLGGYYSGLLNNDIRTMGALVLRGKFEIWRNNPNYRHRGWPENYVEFYYSVYNILGDPDVAYYLDAPRPLQVVHSQSYNVGQTEGRFIVRRADGSPVKGALLTLLKTGETDLSVLTDDNGLALAPLKLTSPDSLHISAIAHQATPYMASVPVVNAARMVGLESITVRNRLGGDGLTTGEPVELMMTLRNFGSEAASGVTATLQDGTDIEVMSATAAFGDIAPGATAGGGSPFRLSVAPHVWPGSQVIFRLIVSDGAGNDYPLLIRIPAAGPQLEYAGHRFEDAQYLLPGTTRNLIVSIANKGHQAISGLHGRMHSHDGAVDFVNDRGNFGDVAFGEIIDSSPLPFRITAREGAQHGRVVQLRLELFDSDDQLRGLVFFNITLGNLEPTDPMGPDAYGYYVYDDTDRAYEPAPRYDWIELDPAFGGSGATLHKLTDDSTTGLRLPFAFRYYGRNYDSVWVCSNGWISFAVKKMDSEFDFTNHPIPSPLGPRSMVAPYWEDLVGDTIAGGGGRRDSIRVFVRHDANGGRFIIEWSRAIARASQNVQHPQTFEVILYDPARHQTRTGDGAILFQYNQASVVDQGFDGTYVTVGFQDYNHMRGIGLTFAARYAPGSDSLRAGRAIKITTDLPDGFLAVPVGPAIQPLQFALDEPFPNPFNARVTISYGLATFGDVHLALYDLQGRLVRELANGRQPAGRHSLILDGSDLATGLYLLRLESGGERLQRKLTLVK